MHSVLYFGTWGLGRAGLDALASHPRVNVRAVFTKFDDAAADPFMNLVRDRARELGLPVVDSSREVTSKGDLTQAIVDAGPVDFLVVCSFDRIFSPKALASARRTAVNIHNSVLPRHRGAKPLDNAIAQGDGRTGVTLHELAVGIDEGDIVLQDDSVPIREDDTYESLFQAQFRVAADLLHRFFDDPDRCLAAKRPQDHAAATQAPRLPFKFHPLATVSEIRSAMVNWRAAATL